MRRPRYFDTRRSHHHTEGNGVEERKRGYRLEGPVATAHGYVYVVALTSGRIPERDDPPKHSWRKWGPVTRLYYLRNGKEYIRDYPRILTRRGAIRCASRFAFEVSGR